jgi:FKBP-type peptidyl-prolyl cis-trans isomerase FkpA
MLKTSISLLLITLLSTLAFATDQPKTEEQKTLYAIGLSVARSLSVFTLTPAELEYVQLGISDVLSGKKLGTDTQSYTGKIQELAQARRKASGEKQIGAGKDFLEKAAKEKGAIKTDTGMVYTSLTDGKGDSPKTADVVKVQYRGTLIDGTEFDSSYKRGKPLEFKLDNVIKCWVEGLQLMKPGGKAKLVCPPQLAYGDKGAGEMILPNATLAFEVELLAILPPSAAGATVSVAPATPAEPAKK